jgi:hypothetical protein
LYIPEHTGLKIAVWSVWSVIFLFCPFQKYFSRIDSVQTYSIIRPSQWSQQA